MIRMFRIRISKILLKEIGGLGYRRRMGRIIKVSRGRFRLFCPGKYLIFKFSMWKVSRLAHLKLTSRHLLNSNRGKNHFKAVK